MSGSSEQPNPQRSYKPVFGIRSRYKKIKSEKGPPGIGFKLTNDGDYDINNKKLTNIQDPTDFRDGVNVVFLKERMTKFLKHLENIFHNKNSNVDMSGKAIKNLSMPLDDYDALPKRYLDQYVLIFDNKINDFNAKYHKIINVSDPKEVQDVATKNYVDNSINQRFTEVDDNIKSGNKNLIEYIDGKLAFQFYNLKISSISEPFFDFSNLYLIQVNRHLWWLSGSLNLKEDIKEGHKILIAELPLQFPKRIKVTYFTYFKVKDGEKVVTDIGFINHQNELRLFLPLEKNSKLIFDSMLFVL